MKRPVFLLIIASFWLFNSSCETLNQITETVVTNPDPTTGEMAGGLKDALTSGIGKAVTLLGKEGGYFNDPILKIPFPEEAQFAANTLRDIGLGSLVDDFERKLNQGAEEGAKLALPIFTDAIKAMSFNDVKNIVLGGENAATDYFKAASSTALYNAFAPKIDGVLSQVGAAKIWTELTTKYNSIPFTNKKVETDLVKYATDRALAGLFLKVAEAEAGIRKDPINRTTELMKKVFDFADRQKG